MAVDLATSGSLGYGIGLQAKVPDKTGLVLQLENQRLKRQALANQAQEEEAQKAAKQEAMFQKAINVDTTKWHRTLVGKVNQAANEAVNEYSRLYAENPRVAQNSINQIMRKFNEQVGQLNTANEQRKQMHKFLNDKVSKNEAFIGDEDEAYNYLNTGDDTSLMQPFQTSLGEYTFLPNSTIQINGIGQSTANEDASKFAGNDKYSIIDFVPTGLGEQAVKTRTFTPEKVKEYMAERYSGAGIAKRGEDIAYNKQALKAAWVASGLNARMTLDQFVRSTDPAVSGIVDNVLINYHQNLLNKNAPKESPFAFKPFDNIKGAAQDLKESLMTTPEGQYLVSRGEVPQENIDKAWEGFKNTDIGKASIKFAGGEQKARDLFDSYLPQPKKTMRQMYQPSGAGKAKQFTWKVEEAPSLKILNAENAGVIRQGMEDSARAGVPLTEMEIVVGKDGKPGLEYANKDITWRIDPKGLEQASYDEIPSDLDRARGWTTGSKDASFPTLFGKFRSVLREKNGKPKYIIIDETSTTGELLGNTWAVPYDLNTSQIINRESIEPVQKKKPAQQTTAVKKYYTKDNKEVDVTGYSQDQINKAIKNKLIFAK